MNVTVTVAEAATADLLAAVTRLLPQVHALAAQVAAGAEPVMALSPERRATA